MAQESALVTVGVDALATYERGQNSRLSPSAITLVTILFSTSTILSVLWQGFRFPSGNNIFHVPVVLQYFDSVEGPHDTFHLALQNYVSGLWVALSTFVTEETIYTTFLSLHSLTRFVILVLLFVITRTLVPRADGRMLALCVALVPFFLISQALTPVGKHEIFPNYLTQSHVVTVFVLSAWLFALRRSWVLSAGCLGFGLNVSAFVSIWGAVALGAAKLWSARRSASLRLLRDTSAMSLAFCLMAAPTLYWIATTIVDAPPVQTPYDFRDFLLEYYPFHNFIDLQIHQAFKVVLIIWINAILLGVLATTLGRGARSVLLGLLSGLSLVFAAGALLPYVSGERLLLLLYPLRSDGYLIFLLFILVLTWLAAEALQQDDDRPLFPFPLFAFAGLIQGNLPMVLASVALSATLPGRASSALRVGGALAFAFLALHTILFERTLLHPGTNMSAAVFADIAWPNWLVICVLSAAIPFFLSGAKRSWVMAILFFLIATFGFGAAGRLVEPVWPVAAVYLATALYLLKSDWPERGDYAVMIGSAGLVAFVIAANGNEIGLWLFASVVCFSLGLAAAQVSEIVRPAIGQVVLGVVPALLLFGAFSLIEAYDSRSFLRLGPKRAAWFETQVWARANTPPDALFATPAGENSFATFSRRPVWIDWKSGATSMWWPDYYPTWSRRLREIRSLKSLAAWTAYARSNGIDYVVFTIADLDEAELELVPLIYRNWFFGIARTSDM